MHDSPPNLRRWMQALVRFLHVEAAGGIVLLACTAIALLLANSPLKTAFAHFWHIKLGNFTQALSLKEMVDDGLMTIFFFVIGLEIKREIVLGELSDLRKAALPILGAAGGMMAPASIYLFLEGGKEGVSGWGIPMATDIAFVVGFLALLGPRVPLGLKVFLLSLAIADDIGAVLVIAVFYSKGLSFLALGLAVLGFGMVIALRFLGVRNMAIYFLVGFAIWFAMLESGVHPTVAGVLLGLLTPARPWIGQSIAPAEHLERMLHPWVAFVIMPIFALANAGVTIDASDLRNPVAGAVALGLILGKPIGIVGASWAGVKLGLARLPTGVTWNLLCAGGCLGGIGFTMSLFITSLAFEENDALLDAGKIGTLLGSACSAIIGCAWAYWVLRARET